MHAAELLNPRRSVRSRTGSGGLVRSLDGPALFALAFGSMIGVGWVTALGSWLSQAGPLGALLAFVAGGAVMVCIGLCYAELTPMLPVAGGEVAFAYRAYGTGKAFLVGWSLALGYVSVSAFEAISVGRVAAYLLPSLDAGEPLYRLAGDPVLPRHLLLAWLGTVFITWLNYVGVAQAARFQKWLIAAFLALTVIFIASAFAGAAWSHLQPLVKGPGIGAALGGTLAVFVSVPFWFVGFDVIPQGAEEAADSVPARRLGLLIVAAIAGATLFYAAVILAVAAVGPWPQIVGDALPTARAFELAFASPLLSRLVLLAALIGLLTSWNGFFLAGSRVLFCLGRAGILPARLGAAHPRYGTPHWAVLFVGLVTLLAPLLGRDALLAFVDVGAFCIGVAFLGVARTAARLRRTAPELPRPFRMPGGLAIPRLATAGALFILAALILPGSPAALAWPREIGLLGLFALLGWVFWSCGRGARGAIDETERARRILAEYAPGESADEAKPLRAPPAHRTDPWGGRS
jgi:APA family basic amino acid/polyamine antiporter